jgi:hypothetical protein
VERAGIKGIKSITPFTRAYCNGTVPNYRFFFENLA